MQKYYLCIDLKSFYASVECVERQLDPMTTNLVVADSSRTEKTICLAVTPSLKKYGISGRARLFEVVSKIREVNRIRRNNAPNGRLTEKSYDDIEIKKDPTKEVDFIIAPPAMAKYIRYSAEVYEIYLKYISPEDIHVYSVDEVFMDITSYLKVYNVKPRELAKRIISDVLNTTGITATAGIGTNMYLAKIAMDIGAKKTPADKDGFRIAELNEMSYRKTLWSHRPLTDFWRVGKGYAKKLHDNYLYTMGDIAKISLTNHGEDLLYKLFGVNAELLIDHAWGWEDCTIKDIKAYKPENRSICSGQVLEYPYTCEKTRLIVAEMAEAMSLELVEKSLVTDQIVLTIGYDIENISNKRLRQQYTGEITTDFYGRKVPKHAHGTGNIGEYTSSTRYIVNTAINLYNDIINPALLVRRINITANHIMPETDIIKKEQFDQMDLFTDYREKDRIEQTETQELARERKIQKATIELRKKFGKNAIFKGTDLKDGATALKRNNQIGGHKA